jgi:hypothetical protein
MLEYRIYVASNLKYGAETPVSSKAVFTFFMAYCFDVDILSVAMLQKLDIYCCRTL